MMVFVDDKNAVNKSLNCWEKKTVLKLAQLETPVTATIKVII